MSEALTTFLFLLLLFIQNDLEKLQYIHNSEVEKVQHCKFPKLAENVKDSTEIQL